MSDTSPVPALSPAPAPAQPATPKEVYAVFCGSIEQKSAERIVAQLTGASVGKIEHVHALFQTAGGYVADGVFLYNFFRTIPIEISLYNAGQISSIGVIAYLGAKNRITTRNATFMIHRSTSSPQFATTSKLAHISKSLVLDDERTEAIVRKHVNFPPALWKALDSEDIYITGDEAVKFGLATAIGDFSP